MLGERLLTALAMLFASTVIQALFMLAANHGLEWRTARFGRAHTQLGRAVLVWLLTLWMMLAVTLQALLWSLVYLYEPELAALPDLQTAFYFSMVTFTTLGYGDVVLSGEWRTLAAIQAANGVIIFGWTTALIFYFIQHIYRRD
jgi:voltage-gated potassium channel Kch